MHRDGSSVMFPLGSWVVSGPAISDPLAQMTQLALILLQLPSWQLKCASTQDKWPQKWHYPWVSLLVLQQPIRAKLLWWLLNLSFKIGRPLCSCFPVAMTSLFVYLFNPVCSFLFFFFFLFFFSFLFFETYKKKDYIIQIKGMILLQAIENIIEK